MYTDGGSIPRVFWSIPGYSPWGYAPAYIIHDWIFSVHQCNQPSLDYTNPDQQTTYDVFDAAQAMSEVLKTMREQDPNVEITKLVLFTIDRAVRTSRAQAAWNGECEDTDLKRLFLDDYDAFIEKYEDQEVLEFVISWPEQAPDG
ncbi:MAG: DUF1353 domain-containing protein [Phycisphaera sp.]|nr:MAG: DUF1353 domain-containing protein [Phycisphaera sp.]